ncbi:DegT/DnrJ/EryC1/StrS family aminotransferase [Candidatus Uhrbacteria bacterium]|nr:DegT/DnrJ/EryC1/StrS family aminotransferase [Candidatus Uhrbacteria bacterium]
MQQDKPAFGYTSKDYVLQGNLIVLSDEKTVWEALPTRVRTSVRKGERSGVRIRDFDPVEDLAKVVPFTPNDDDIPPTFETRHRGFVAEAEDTGEMLGWVLTAGIGKKNFLLCHASTPAGKKRETPNMLLWRAIKESLGTYGFFDVGVSYRPSLQFYFSGYGQQKYPMVMRPTDLPIDLRITPFDTAAYGVEPGPAVDGVKLLGEVFGTDQWTFFPRAMFAIAGCLMEYRDQGRLTADDEVLISTTTGSPYISSCVTKAIESVCRWSQMPSDKTKAVLLIHEFGFPNPHAAEMRAFCDQRRIPLIEDLAYGWGSEGTGSFGDVKIVSFTKLFPVQFGGALIGMNIPLERHWKVLRSSDPAKGEEVLGLIPKFWQPLEEIRAQRQKIWKMYADRLASVRDAWCELEPGVMPGAFILKMQDEEEMKRISAFVKRFGIEVGNWYHHAAIFLPCHQRMTRRHVDYVCGAILANFRENCGIPGVRC